MTSRGVVVDVVGVGHQADLLQEGVEIVGLAGGADQLVDVLQPAGRLDRVLGLQLAAVPGAVQHRFEDGGRAVGPSVIAEGEEALGLGFGLLAGFGRVAIGGVVPAGRRRCGSPGAPGPAVGRGGAGAAAVAGPRGRRRRRSEC